ncbi:MAG: MBL fold metallo-hydrolase [Bacteroidales bacterium]|nr:MBL fold metallo-hydrolase [Bacteroidales bacterium]
MKRLLILMALCFLSLFSCKGYRDLSVDEFNSMLSQDRTVQLLDVRTPEEFAENHLPGAINIDWRGEAFSEKVQVLDKARPVLVYCRSGRRSAEAAKTMDGIGFKTYNMKGGILAWTEAGKRVTKYEVERFWTASGAPVDITLVKHGSLEICYNGVSIQIDPVSGLGKPTDYDAEFPKADVILVTHEHHDHLDPEAIAALTGPETILILNETSRDIIGRGEAIHNGESRELPGGVKLEAVPAYNTTPGREQFHPKGNGNGYVLSIDGLRIYVAGDTENIPEMSELKFVDVAFLPVNQPYTMTPEQCIAAAKLIRPKVLIPYHFGQTDLGGLPMALPQMDVRIRQMQ